MGRVSERVSKCANKKERKTKSEMRTGKAEKYKKDKKKQAQKGRGEKKQVNEYERMVKEGRGCEWLGVE